MDRLRSLTYLFLTLCLAISLNGCGGKSDTKSGATAFANQDSILKFIPADTPYVFAAAEEMQEEAMSVSRTRKSGLAFFIRVSLMIECVVNEWSHVVSM